jgi:hypothetical protein
MDQSYLDAVTKSLSDFAQTRFSSQILELKGPVQEASSYRWRLISTRYKEVTVLLVTKKLFLGKPAPVRFEVYGLEQTTELKPNLDELQSYLDKSELTLIR